MQSPLTAGCRFNRPARAACLRCLCVYFFYTNLSEELLEEGFVYEVISKIQTMRKDAGFEVMDHIKVSVCGNEKVEGIVARNEAMIAGKVLADAFVGEEALAVSKEWNVNGETVTIGGEKVNA